MRVFLVMESTIGGTRRHITDLSRGLREAGHDVHLVASALRQADFEEDLGSLERVGCRVHRLPMVRAVRPGTDWRHARRIAAWLREVRPDVVHTHSSKAGVLGRRASLATGIGVRVHTPHTFAFLFDAMFGRAKRALFRAVERHYGRHTHRTIAVSETEAETIRSSGVVAPERVRTVANGIDAGEWSAARPALREELGLPEGAWVLAVVGLLNPAKGQDLAIEALAEHGDEDAHLLLVGHGDDEPSLRRLTEERGVARRVHFLGWRTDVPALLATCDWLVLPSRWEGMPYVVLEAMAAGKPVLATEVDGARDMVRDGETGVLVEVGSASALARGMQRARETDAETARAWGAAGARRVVENYSVEAMVRGTVGVYEEALG